MMPKGVEHLKYPLDAVECETVRIPMMPKGVEHVNFTPQTNDYRGENSDDAERR